MHDPLRRATASFLTGLVAVIATSALTACASNGPTSVNVDADVSGLYVLQTIQGKSVPAPYQVGSPTITMLSDTLRLVTGGVAAETQITYSVPGYPKSPTTDTTRMTGTWAATSNTVTIIYGGGSAILTGAASGGNTLTLTGGGNLGPNSQGDTEVFVRQ